MTVQPPPSALRPTAQQPDPSDFSLQRARRWLAFALAALLGVAGGLSGGLESTWLWGALGLAMICCAGVSWELRRVGSELQAAPPPDDTLSASAPEPPSPRSVAESDEPSPLEGMVETPPAPPKFSIPPVRDDAYEWLGKLSEGHMGEVWKARHKRLGRLCVIKSVQPTRMGDVEVGRFKREARVTAGLLSPHTVRVYDFGLRDDGAFFYAMELLSGVDLQVLVRKHGPMPPERVARILLQVCHSLGEAHQAGLVHRDLKPANIMLCAFGVEVDFVKVLDFGLAKDQKEPAEATHLTSEKTVLGTAAYLAPESLRGSSTVDARADLYALGCIAYWLLTARLLFEHDQPVVMAKAHLLEAAPRVRDTKPEVPKALDELIQRCLEKDPAARPQTAEEIAASLSEMGLGAGWTNDRARNWWSEHPTESG